MQDLQLMTHPCCDLTRVPGLLLFILTNHHQSNSWGQYLRKWLLFLQRDYSSNLCHALTSGTCKHTCSAVHISFVQILIFPWKLPTTQTCLQVCAMSLLCTHVSLTHTCIHSWEYSAVEDSSTNDLLPLLLVWNCLQTSGKDIQISLFILEGINDTCLETFYLHSAISNISSYGRNRHVKTFLLNFLDPMLLFLSLWHITNFKNLPKHSNYFKLLFWQLIRTGSEEKTMFLIRLNISLNPQCLETGNATCCY